MEEISEYHFLFDRRRGSHPWFPSLEKLQNEGYPENAALVENWRMDHRVSQAKERGMSASGPFPVKADPTIDFGRAISSYFQEFLCVPAATVGSIAPAYALESNRQNRIPADRISPKQKLIHLASLNALLPRILGSFDVQDALYQWTGEYPPEPEALNQAHVDTIATALQAQGEDAVRELAGLIADHLGPNEPHWWAAFAFEVDGCLAGDDWTEAVRILGLGQLWQGDWLMGWRYSPVLAGPLFRPTVAEAGFYGYHFPSPPEEALGVTMPLEVALPAVKEVIHAPLKGDISAEACMGRLGRIAQPLVTTHNPTYAQWLKERRMEHALHLKSHYQNQSVSDWLTRHGLNR